MKIKRLLLVELFLGFGCSAFAQLENAQVHGDFQSDVQYYRPDSAIGAPPVPEKLRTNNFANVIVTAGKFTAGIRYEAYLPPLQGFDPRFKGSGIPFRYATYTDDQLSFTVGNFYEQFGSGLVLRSYEERGLGFDNAMDGVRVKYKVHPAVQVKGVFGRMRSFFNLSPGLVRGADIDISVNDLLPGWDTSSTRWFIGGSIVSKFQDDQNPDLILPQNVGSGAGRIQMTSGAFNIMAEYARRSADPSLVNKEIYRAGECLLVQATYSVDRLGVLVGVKRTDNFDFRANRNATGNNLNINFLPALTRQHTYMLAATIYPYATQPLGEMAAQAELTYSWPKGSVLGGKYGTSLMVNFSAVNSIAKNDLNDLNTRRIGYSSNFLKVGNTVYYRDLNIELTKKLSPSVKGTLMYQHLVYNKDVVQGLVGFGTIYADVAIADITWKINSDHILRMEAQHLETSQDLGSWAMGLVEYTLAPKWFLAVFDQYNYGNKHGDQRIHYITGAVGHNHGTTRVQMSYGRQRAGIVCVGGVCRNVPASNGLMISVTHSF